jgi:hypothetical protein
MPAADRILLGRNETLTHFRQAVADSSADLEEKVGAGADLVALGKENEI